MEIELLDNYFSLPISTWCSIELGKSITHHSGDTYEEGVHFFFNTTVIVSIVAKNVGEISHIFHSYNNFFLNNN